jgi:hypothetical protein
MVTSVHDTCAGDESCAEGRDHYDECAPDFSLCVEDVQFGGEVQREVEQASERDCGLLVMAMQPLREDVPLLCPEGKLLNPSCRM